MWFLKIDPAPLFYGLVQGERPDNFLTALEGPPMVFSDPLLCLMMRFKKYFISRKKMFRSEVLVGEVFLLVLFHDEILLNEGFTVI